MATHSSVLAWRTQGRGSLVGCRLWGRTESDIFRCARPSGVPRGPATSTGSLASQKNNLDSLFSSPSSTEWHMIGFSISRFTLEFVSIMVIFRALKDKRMVLVLRKGYNT